MKAMATTAKEPTKLDAHDGDPWSEMDIRDLTLAMKAGDTVEEAASFLCRSGTVECSSQGSRAGADLAEGTSASIAVGIRQARSKSFCNGTRCISCALIRRGGGHSR